MLKRTITPLFIAALITGAMFAGPKLIRKVKPAYPAEAEQAGITGTVRLEAIVAPDGTVANVVRILIGGNPILVRAAVDAVRQWQYERVLFDGKSVAFMTSIKMDFTLPAAIAIEDHPGSSAGMRVVHVVDPVYPLAAKTNRITGTVRLRALIGKDGAVESLQTLDGDPALVVATEQAVRQWRYQPVTIAGEPVEVLVDIEQHFLIK